MMGLRRTSLGLTVTLTVLLNERRAGSMLPRRPRRWIVTSLGKPKFLLRWDENLIGMLEAYKNLADHTKMIAIQATR